MDKSSPIKTTFPAYLIAIFINTRGLITAEKPYKRSK